MKVMPVPLDLGAAACARPEHLPLVDAAAARPGGSEAQQMKATLCRHCPVAKACHQWAMTHAEVGIWGAASPRDRNKAGAPKNLPVVPRTLYTGAPEGVPMQEWRRKVKVREVGTKPRRPSGADVRCLELGVRGCDVKRWAHEQGLTPTISGRVSLAHVEAYAAAHQAA